MHEHGVVEGALFRQAMRSLAGGVAIVTSGAGERRRGMTMTAVTSLSADPPTLLACINRTAATHDVIGAHGSFAVNLLGHAHQELAERFAGMTGVSGAARFEGAAWRSGVTGVPMLEDAIGVIECRLVDYQSYATHGLFIGAVVATHLAGGDPLLNFGGAFRRLAEHAGVRTLGA